MLKTLSPFKVREKRIKFIKQALPIASLTCTSLPSPKSSFLPSYWITTQGGWQATSCLPANRMRSSWTDSFPVDWERICRRSLTRCLRNRKKNRNSPFIKTASKIREPLIQDKEEGLLKRSTNRTRWTTRLLPKAISRGSLSKDRIQIFLGESPLPWNRLEGTRGRTTRAEKRIWTSTTTAVCCSSRSLWTQRTKTCRQI